MEFWGVEVKAGEPLKVKPELGYVIHLSQACLGETKKDKGNDSVLLNLKVGDQKLVLGLLSLEKIPQLPFDLVFEKEFELSHNWKNGSVYFCGYQTQYGEDLLSATNDFSDLDDSEEEEEDVPSAVTENGKGGQKVEQAKPATAKSNAAKPESSEKPKVKVVEPSKDENDEDSDDDDDDDDSDGDEGSDDESDDEDMLDADSDDDDEGSDEKEDEETPKKVESGKKRPNQSAVKTPLSVKKAKPDSAQKSGGKKGAPHTATPHPAKNAGKTPGTADKSKAQTPKSGGQFSCKSCTKSFGSDNALQSHSKAKHGGN